MSDIYEDDFAVWADEQARALRAHVDGGNVPVDWAHVIEEIEGLAGSDRRELRNRIRTIMTHLLKLQFSKDEAPRRGWTDTVIEQRGRLDTLLADNRSMGGDIIAVIAGQIEKARWEASESLARHGDAGVVDPAAILTPDQVLGHWWPTPAA